MNNKIKEIKGFIWENIDTECGTIIENDNFYDISGLIHYTNKKFGCNIEYDYIGGFESPGYDVDCYAWAGIIEGELYFDSLEQERY